MVNLWGRPWTRRELLARALRLDQVAGVQLVEAGDGAERGARLLRLGTEDIDALASRIGLLTGQARRDR